jgi:hypothetical protein
MSSSVWLGAEIPQKHDPSPADPHSVREAPSLAQPKNRRWKTSPCLKNDSLRRLALKGQHAVKSSTWLSGVSSLELTSISLPHE